MEGGIATLAEALNVPPSLVEVMRHDPGLPNCMMLHKNMMVAWDSFPPQLTIQLDARSELIRDWAVHGPLGAWAAQLLGASEVRLYNAEMIFHRGEDSPTCRPTRWSSSRG